MAHLLVRGWLVRHTFGLTAITQPPMPVKPSPPEVDLPGDLLHRRDTLMVIAGLIVDYARLPALTRILAVLACCPSGASLRRSGSSLPLARRDSAESSGNDDWRSWLLRTREARPSKISGTISAGLPSRSQLRLRRAPWTISAFRADALMASPSWKSMAR